KPWLEGLCGLDDIGSGRLEGTQGGFAGFRRRLQCVVKCRDAHPVGCPVDDRVNYCKDGFQVDGTRESYDKEAADFAVELLLPLVAADTQAFLKLVHHLLHSGYAERSGRFGAEVEKRVRNGFR